MNINFYSSKPEVVMKRLVYYLIGFTLIATILIIGCDDSSIIKDNTPPPPPPPDSQTFASSSSNQVVSDTSGFIPNQYIVVFKDQGNGLINQSAAVQAKRLTNSLISDLNISNKKVKNRYEYALKGFTAKLSENQLKILKQDPRIDHVTQDHTFDFAPSSAETHTLPIATFEASSSQARPWGISRVGGPLDGNGQTAWILDTGIDLDHPDLNVDVVNSVSFVADESANDIQGHGTHVAGILAAEDNSRDVVGVASGAEVVTVKVLHDDPEENEYSEIIDGIDYVASRASTGDIVNMSLGDPTPDNADIDNAIITAANNGIRFVIAAGNENQNAQNVTPARVEHANVWTASAYDINDNFASFSNFGNPPIEYSGPGVNILSLWKNGGTNTIGGTLQAAPHVAGLLLALGSEPNHSGTVSNDPDNDPDEIVSARPLTPTVSGTIQNHSPRLDWPAITDAQSYEIYRKFEAGSWSLHGTTSNSYYTDTDIYSFDLQKVTQPPYDFSDTYAYRVEAVPAAGKNSFASSIIYYVLDCTGKTCTQSVEQ